MSSFKVNSNENELNEGDIVDKDYLIGNVHSTGTSSVIRLAKHLPSSTSLAVKIVKKNPKIHIFSRQNRIFHFLTFNDCFF